MNKKTIKTIKKRNSAWNKYKKVSSDENYKRYKELRNKVVKLIRSDKSEYQRNLIRGFQHNPKRFYGYMRRMRTVKSTVSHMSSDRTVI